MYKWVAEADHGVLAGVICLTAHASASLQPTAFPCALGYSLVGRDQAIWAIAHIVATDPLYAMLSVLCGLFANFWDRLLVCQGCSTLGNQIVYFMDASNTVLRDSTRNS